MKHALTALVLSVLVLIGIGGRGHAACLTYDVDASSYEVKSTPVQFRANDVPLRAGPGVQYCSIREIAGAKDRPAKITAAVGTWRRIVFEGDMYWVHQNLLTKRR